MLALTHLFHVLGAFPAPFYRTLQPAAPGELPLQGNDVTILQQLLRRVPGECTLACGCGCSHRYDEPTWASLNCYMGRSDGVFDEAAGSRILTEHASDHYVPDDTPANATGHLYKLLVPVHRNRSIETMARLLDARNVELHTFRVRAHGHDVDSAGLPVPEQPWPHFSTGIGLNQFSTDGNTPTGLSEIDLNSPESSAKLYGPYPVQRFVRGLSGNAQFLLSPPTGCERERGVASSYAAPAAPIRSGILVHTGQWSNHSSWQPGEPMPNSAGCVHAYPKTIEQIWKLLVGLGVQVRPNTNGRQPYPYKPQGLVAVYEVR